MGRMQIVLPDYVEDWLRSEAQRKGDLSNMITTAIIEHFKIPKQSKEPITFQVKDK